MFVIFDNGKPRQAPRSEVKFMREQFKDWAKKNGIARRSWRPYYAFDCAEHTTVCYTRDGASFGIMGTLRRSPMNFELSVCSPDTAIDARIKATRDAVATLERFGDHGADEFAEYTEGYEAALSSLDAYRIGFVDAVDGRSRMTAEEFMAGEMQ